MGYYEEKIANAKTLWELDEISGEFIHEFFNDTMTEDHYRALMKMEEEKRTAIHEELKRG